MSWISTTIYWYAIIFMVGAAALPITRKIFSSFLDYGYPFAKTVGILLTSYLVLTLSTAHILPFTSTSVFSMLLIIFGAGILLWRRSKVSRKINSTQIAMIIFEEMLFFVSLIFWTYVRGQEPSIRGLEKFMDYGFINTALNAQYFPPADMWLAGHSINYYFFGHVVGAVLTKLSGIASSQTYNLILATIFALGITTTFSLTFNLLYHTFGKRLWNAIGGGILGTFIVNFGGNLHTIYAFTTGYQNEEPIPFWKIMSGFNPEKYWYPNATRFIPFTIHEFPMYSYVVADLHGHVFDIPFVLLTMALIIVFVVNIIQKNSSEAKLFDFLSIDKKKLPSTTKIINFINLKTNYFVFAIGIGFMLAVHYMTNAFDAGVYLLLAGFVLWHFLGFSKTIILSLVMVAAFLLFSLPFSLHFTPFASGIGVNCAPTFLTNLKTLGPFLFEAGNCQLSPFWMILILWGFFWFNGLFLTYIVLTKSSLIDKKVLPLFQLVTIMFALSTLLIFFPEALYLKDIYPSHFRANTMFKLGYQAFMMMGIGSAFAFVALKRIISKLPFFVISYLFGFVILFFFIAIYPIFATRSYYGRLNKTPTLDGTTWINTVYPEYLEIISYLESSTAKGTIILEAQGDSYTDFNVVSSYSGRATVAGWWVHQWLWRGSSDVVGKLIPEIEAMYQSQSLPETKRLLNKYRVEYVIIGTNERQKYKELNEKKFEALGQAVFRSNNGIGIIYKIPLDSN